MAHARRTGGLDRRAFMKRMAGLGGALFAAGYTRLPLVAAGRAAWSDRIGVQLYTVRDLMQQDFEGTVEQVAKIGYKEVEFAGYYDRTPDQVRALLDRLGLRAPSTHVGLELLRDDLAGQLATAQTVGHTYVTVPSLPGAFGGQLGVDAWHGFAEEFNTLGMACKEAGLRFAYHNHSFEFTPVDGEKTGYEILLDETDADLVSFEMDLMWAILATEDPLAWFKRYPGRFTMWHVKDLKDIAATQAAAGQGREGFRVISANMSAVGEGDIDYEALFAQAQQSGLEHFFVENDFPKDSLANIQTSYNHLADLLAGG